MDRRAMPTPRPAQPVGPVAGLSPALRGVGWALASVVAATAMTLLVRALSAEMHTAMMAFLRSAVGLAFLAPVMLRPGRPRLGRLTRPGGHLLRGALLAAALNLGFYAIWKLPVATATILFFLAPVFSTLLAPWMTGERVGPRRLAAVAAGFLGALVVLRPGAAPLDAGALAALGSSACFALALLMGRTLSRADGSDAVFATSALWTCVLTLPPALLHWAPPGSAAVWALALGLAAASSARSWADIRSFALGDASVVGPVSYLRLPAVAAAGWALYGERPDALDWAGAAVIAAATLYILIRDRAPPPPQPG
jgi:drug/metabolite transporter (DMT)-like permease